MRDRSRQIGFSQRIRLEWLERTAYLVLAGNDNESINTALAEFLQDKLSIGGKAQRGNREKAITILMKIWSNVPSELTSLRDSGLSLFKSLPRDVHIAIHWGMAMAVYPFWGAVASSTGRLLRLQGTASASQVQRRLREKYGERETVSRDISQSPPQEDRRSATSELAHRSLSCCEHGSLRNPHQPNWLPRSVPVRA